MRRSIFAALLAAFLWGCGTAPKHESDPATEPRPAPVTLTEEDTAAGWTLLFDGVSSDGWHRYGSTEFPGARWTIQDGELVIDASDGIMSGDDLVTDEVFTSYELRFEFKVGPRGNSGVFYRVLETDEAELWQNAPEYQVLDDSSYSADGALAQHLTASNYDMHPAVGGSVKPLGEWNEGRIVIDGNRVEHWLNGMKVVEYEFGSEEWLATVATSKFSEFPEYGKTVDGRIALQDHGEAAAYRNIKIRVLD